jgi:hypothetical protein
MDADVLPGEETDEDFCGACYGKRVGETETNNETFHHDGDHDHDSSL